jgi:MSHA biogenesis protein MshK
MKQPASLIGGALAALLMLPAGATTELNDPTRPADVKPAATASTATASAPARLQAILHSQDRAVAIISGKLLHVGDWVGDARIVAIDADCVRFTRAGRSMTLRVARQAMKVRRTAGTEDPQ